MHAFSGLPLDAVCICLVELEMLAVCWPISKCKRDYNIITNHNGLARAFASLRAVLRVNNSLSGHVAALLLGLVTHYRES